MPAGQLNDDEAAAWTTIASSNGRTVRTNSHEGYADGCRFISVHDAGGTQLGWWPSEAWADPTQSTATMSTLWSLAAAGETVFDSEYGVELTIPLPNGEVRADPHGSYVRLLDADGGELDGGAAYWTSDEWLEEPELVLGAVLGAARSLT